MSRKSPIWDLEKPDTFIKTVRKLKKENKAAAKRLGRIMDELLSSNFPNRLGEKKLTKYGIVFTVDLDKSRGLRLSYTVDFTNKIITVIRVGDHKDVYGHD